MKRCSGFFVTGTDTGVGKTELACGLIQALQVAGYSAVGMKPVAAGARRVQGRLRNADAELLDRSSRVRAPATLRNPYIFTPPIAPHIAAAEAGVTVDIDVLVRRCQALSQRADVVIVEGAGGFLVPLGERVDMAALAMALDLPVIMVVGMRLGCLSHALLTAEAIERRGLTLAGWVANRIDARMHRYRENVRSLQTRIHAPLLADVPSIPSAAVRRRRLGGLIDLAGLEPLLPPRPVS